MPTPSRRRPVVVFVALALAVAGVVILARRHAASPRRPVVVQATPTPSQVRVATPTVAASPTPTPAPIRTPSPTPRRTVAPTVAASTPAPSPASTVVGGITLVDSPYGFKVPQGWRFSPLATTTGTAQAAHWTDPSSAARMDYLVDNTSAIYSPDHVVNLGTIEVNLPCQNLPPTSFTYVSGRGPRYTCGQTGGLDINGMVLLLPYPQGFRLLQIQLPPSDDAVAGFIITAFH